MLPIHPLTADPVALARTYVPFAFRALPLAVAFAFGPVAHAASRFVMFQGLGELARLDRSRPDAHWSERARLAFSTRGWIALLSIVMPLVAGLGMSFTSGNVALASVDVTVTVASISAFVGVFLAGRQLGRTLGFAPRRLADDLLDTILLYVSLASFVLILFGLDRIGTGIAERALDTGAAGVALVLVALIWQPQSIRYALGRLRPDPELFASFDATFARMGIRPAAFWVMERADANAFANPLARSITVTRGLVDELDHDELEAVVAHEVGHLTEGRVALVRAVPLALFALGFFVRPFGHVAWVSWPALAWFFAVLVARGLTHRWSRRLESGADSAAHSAIDGATYARALERIHALNLIPAVLRGTTHPSLYDRMTAAGAAPTWPRPSPPARGPNVSALVSVVLVAMLGLTWNTVAATCTRSGPSPLLIAAVTRNDGLALVELARLELADGEPTRAVGLYRAALALGPERMTHHVAFVKALVSMGECADARRALATARARARTEYARETLEDAAPAVGRCVNRL